MAEADESISSPASLASGESAEQALQAAVDLYGPSMFYEGDALRSYLQERCPEAVSDIALILVGLEEQVPQALLSVHTDDDLRKLIKRLELRLTTRRALNPYAAEWTVKTWAQVLRLWSVAQASPSIAGALEPQTAEDIQRSNARLQPTAREGSLEETLAVAQASSTAEPVGSARPRSAVAATAWTRWLGIGGALAAIAIVVAVIRFETTQPAAPSLPASREPAVAAPPVASQATVSSSVTAPSSAPRPAVEIVDVGSDEPLIGDGRQRELFVSLRTRRDDIASVESRFVGGDAALWSQPVVVDVSSKSMQDTRVPAGMIGVRTKKPIKATFEYIVTTSDGKRSAPFTRELTVAPVAATPPSIVDIAVPAGVVVGKPFSLSIAYRKGDGNLASIERAVIDDKGEAKVVATTGVATLKASKEGAIDLPMRAPKTTRPRTMELTLVDDDGQRSAPRRVSFDVSGSTTPATTSRASGAACTRETCGSIASVREVDAGGGLVSRVANALHLSSAKAGERAQRSYDVTVRTDDRALHTLRQSSAAKAGARVRIVGGKLVTLDDPNSRKVPHRRGRLVPESEPIINQ